MIRPHVRPHARPGLAMLCAALLLAGCGEGGLLESGPRPGPDEFTVLPTRPLEMPADLNSLPSPAPGTINRVDYRPIEETVALLSGSPVAGVGGNGALVAQAGPAAPGIRPVLAVENAEFKRTHRGLLLERWIIDNPEVVTYGSESLDENQAWEQAKDFGLQVPAAPPPPDD